MFCPNCGANNPDNALHCANCGTALHAQPQPKPAAPTPAPQQTPPADFKHYQTLNIILTVYNFLCCSSGWFFTGFLSLLPSLAAVVLSILGVVFSSQAKSAYAAGDYNLALSKAKTAKTMAIINVVINAVLILSCVLLVVLALVFGIGTGALALMMEEMGLNCIALH